MTRTHPKAAASKSTVNAVQLELIQVKVRLNKLRFSLDHGLVKLQRKLTRLYDRLERSQRR